MIQLQYTSQLFLPRRHSTLKCVYEKQTNHVNIFNSLYEKQHIHINQRNNPTNKLRTTLSRKILDQENQSLNSRKQHEKTLIWIKEVNGNISSRTNRKQSFF